MAEPKGGADTSAAAGREGFMAFKLPSLTLPSISFGKKSNLAVDIGTSAVKICRLSGGRGKYKIDLWDSLPMPPGLTGKEFETKAAELLSQLISKNKIKQKNVIFCLPSQAVVIRYLTLKGIPKERLEGVVRHEAEGHIPFPLAEVSLDWCEARKTADGYDVLLVAIKQDKLDSLVAVIEEAGLEVQVVDVTTLALFSLYYNSELKQKTEEQAGAEVFVDIGAGTTDIAFLKDQRVFFTRSVPIAGRSFTEIISKRMDVSEEKADRLKIKHAEVKAITVDLTALEGAAPGPGGLGAPKAPGMGLPSAKAPGLAPPSASGGLAPPKPAAGGLAPPSAGGGGLAPPKLPGLTPPAAGGLTPPSAKPPAPADAGAKDKEIPKKSTEVPLPKPPTLSLPKPASQTPAEPAGLKPPGPPAAPATPTPPPAPAAPKPPTLSLPKPPGSTPAAPGSAPAAPQAPAPPPAAPKPPTLSLPKPPGSPPAAPGAPQPPGPPKGLTPPPPGGKSLGAAKAEDGEVFSLFESEDDKTDVDKEKLSAAVKPIADRMVTELRRSFDYFSSQLSGGEIKKVILSGGGASLKGLAEYLGAQLNVPVSVFDPMAKIQAPAGSQIPNPQIFSATLGMGMRMLDGTPLDINLIPVNIQAVRRVRSMGKDLKWLAVAAGLLIAQFGAYAYLVQRNTTTLFNKLQSDIQELEPVVSRTRQLEKDQKTVNDLEKSISSLVAAKANWIQVLVAFDKTLPENASVATMSMGAKDEINIRVRTGSLNEIPEIGRRFQSPEYTKNYFTLTNRPSPKQIATTTGEIVFEVEFNLRVNHAASQKQEGGT